MAAREMEAAQKALRKADYDSDDETNTESESSQEVQTRMIGETTSSTMRQRGGRSVQNSVAFFDPYAPTTMDTTSGTCSTNEFSFEAGASTHAGPRDTSLMDDSSVHSQSNTHMVDEYPNNSNNATPTTEVTTSAIPGGAGYLEMEGEPPRRPQPPLVHREDTEPIQTSSGLLLTHRRTSPAAPRRPPLSQPHEHGISNDPSKPKLLTIFDKSDPLLRNTTTSGRPAPDGGFKNIQRDYFEVEHGYSGWKAANESSSSSYGNGRHSVPMVQARRFLSFVRIWMVVSAAFLMLATGVMMHSFGHSDHVAQSVIFKERSGGGSVRNGEGLSGAAAAVGGMTPQQASQSIYDGLSDHILLVPMENISDLARQKLQQQEQPLGQSQRRQLDSHTHPQDHNGGGVRRVLLELRQEFETWVAHHRKQYHSNEEKEHRFNIWSQNHHRTMEKNQKHGKLTKKTVFGSNHFQDLLPEEFKAKFLTGYKGPTTDELEAKRRQMTPQKRQLSQHRGRTLKPGLHRAKMHDSIKQRMLQNHQEGKTVKTTRNANCNWYDVSCFLRWIWNTAGIQFGAIVGTMEPRYDADAYPVSVDWRDYGVVTEIRSQGDCGACWAITAVETVESAHAIATGDLYDLSESEVITCDDSCEMCSGGWPQNAFEWVMDHGGLPLYNSFPYNANTLLSMTKAIEGTSYTWTEATLEEYRQKMCPTDESGSGSQDSQDSYWQDGSDNNDYGDYTDQGRYGNIRGYGYATDRCICYSDGSGCSCNDQDEELAVGNIATYGPAVVCVEASLWQDYSSGIMTSDIGCGSEFLDMNHCVQVVGYAFTDGSDDGGDGNDNNNDNSGSQSASQDSSEREGYWIVRNQWGAYWGMNGYAYIAMGDNTCGILNDMTQAYLED